MFANPHTSFSDHTEPTVADWCAIGIGTLLLVEGIWGLFHPVVLGVLTTNTLDASIHIVLGIAGVALGIKGWPEGYLLFLGVLLIAVGVLYFVPVAAGWLVQLLNMNVAAAALNVVVGAIALLVRRPMGMP